MRRDPLVHIAELRLAESTTAGNLVALAFLSASGVLEVDGFQVVFVGVTPTENTQRVAAMVATGTILERTAELAIVSAHFLPMALEVAEKIVRSGKPTLANFAHMWA